MSLRSELIGLVDEVRDQVIDEEIGLRLHTVQTRRRTWSGGEVGRGTTSDVTTTLSPAPKVSDPPARLTVGAGGKFEAGDRYVSKISATYSASQLSGGALAAGVEFCWLIDGQPYRVVGEPEEKYLGWRVHLRRMNR